jgi:hypothetical protein
MIDFQASSKGGGVYDVGYFLSQNLATDVRRAHEDDLLRTYHDALVAGGVTGYPFDRFRADYRYGALYGWFIPVFAVGTLDHSSERAMALWTEVIGRAQAAMDDHEAAGPLGCWADGALGVEFERGPLTLANRRSIMGDGCSRPAPPAPGPGGSGHPGG